MLSAQSNSMHYKTTHLREHKFVNSFSSCGLLKDSKASGLKWREKKKQSLGSFICPQASSHSFLLSLLLGKFLGILILVFSLTENRLSLTDY